MRGPLPGIGPQRDDRASKHSIMSVSSVITVGTCSSSKLETSTLWSRFSGGLIRSSPEVLKPQLHGNLYEMGRLWLKPVLLAPETHHRFFWAILLLL